MEKNMNELEYVKYSDTTYLKFTEKDWEWFLENTNIREFINQSVMLDKEMKKSDLIWIKSGETI